VGNDPQGFSHFRNPSSAKVDTPTRRGLVVVRTTVASIAMLKRNDLPTSGCTEPQISADFEQSTALLQHQPLVLHALRQSPSVAMLNYQCMSRASGLQLERVGDWIFAFEPERTISPDKVDGLIDDSPKTAGIAKAFPQNVYQPLKHLLADSRGLKPQRIRVFT
jgi:hypothetical protein